MPSPLAVSGWPAEKDLVSLAGSLGVVDALVFRRVTPTRWAHLGGLGRGRGWAGIIDIDESDDPLAARIPDRAGQVYRTGSQETARVLGPYYAVGGAVVRVSHDVAVVLGNPAEPLPRVADADLLRLAERLEASIGEVLPSKRLADELEVLHAVQAMMQAPTHAGVPATLRHVLQVAVRALSCEIGVLRYGPRDLAAIAPSEIRLDDAQWHELLDGIDSTAGRLPWCVQDVPAAPAARALMAIPGVRSLLALAVPARPGGLLLVAHTGRGPRGFTTQCQRLAQHVVGTGSVLAHTAALYAELRTTAEQATRAARTDPLTGLGNRLAWDEALAAAQLRVDAGAAVSILTLDVDGLKTVNDRRGHDAGDDLLRRCAAALRRRCQPHDVAVRMGGDEFAVLFAADPDTAKEQYRQLAADLGALTSDQHTVTASIGLATAEPGGRLPDAVRDADIQMYQHKRRRRRQRTALSGHRQRPGR